MWFGLNNYLHGTEDGLIVKLVTCGLSWNVSSPWVMVGNTDGPRWSVICSSFWIPHDHRDLCNQEKPRPSFLSCATEPGSSLCFSVISIDDFSFVFSYDHSRVTPGTIPLALSSLWSSIRANCPSSFTTKSKPNVSVTDYNTPLLLLHCYLPSPTLVNNPVCMLQNPNPSTLVFYNNLLRFLKSAIFYLRVLENAAAAPTSAKLI